MSWRVTRTGSNVDFDSLLRGAVVEAKQQSGNPSGHYSLDRCFEFLTEIHKSYPKEGQVEFVLTGHRTDDGFGNVGCSISLLRSAEDQPVAVAAAKDAEPAPDPVLVDA